MPLPLRAARPALLFDLDGTLTDPELGITRSLRHALERLELPCPSQAELAACIGPPLRGTFARFLGSEDAAAVERAMAAYRERFATVGLFENRVYPGIEEMLAAVRAAGAVCFVATSKPAVYAERILTHFGLRRHFQGVYGPDLAGRHEDKRELLAHLLEREGIGPEGAVMIGDRAVDVAAARANRARAVGVLWGFGSRDELAGAGADLLCGSPAELPATLAGLAP